MSLISSVFKMTCPRCRQGKMFEQRLNFRHPLKMNSHCPVCGQSMEPEVGFYYGAMFISYAFIGITSLVLVGILVFLFKIQVEWAFGILLVFIAFIFLWNLRFARSVWIHMVIRHDRRYKEG